MKMTFSNLSAYAQNAFGSEDKLRGFINLGTDLANGRAIFDAEGNEIDKRDAEKQHRQLMLNFLGLDEHSTHRDRKRALRAHGIELMQVLEEEIDQKIATGFHESEWFNALVDERNLALGDSQEFYVPDDTLLSVTRVSGDHHDFVLQRLGTGQSYTVPTSTYGLAVGADIDMVLSGRTSWAELTDAVAAAFVRHVQNAMYTGIMGASKDLPAQFKGTGALSFTTKANFDKLLDDVSIANGNVPVYIMGTKTALKAMNGFASVEWAPSSSKEDMASLGRLSHYEGTRLVEIPQRFTPNDPTKYLVDNTKLLIFPEGMDKPVKFVDVGETEIEEILDKGQKDGFMADIQKYEVQRQMGVSVVLGRMYGEWTITT